MNRLTLLAALLFIIFVHQSHAEDPLPIVGKHEKIRYGFSQWNHFGDGGVGEEEFISSLKNVGLTVLAGNPGDEGRRWSEIAHRHGIRYYAGLYISTLYDNRVDEWRLAVDRSALSPLRR